MATSRSFPAPPSSTVSRKSTECGPEYQPHTLPKRKGPLEPRKIVVGVDPGLKGGICVDGHPFPMPVDDGELMCREIANLFSRATLICIEIQGYRPGQGGVVTNLANYGRLLGIAEINAKVLDVAPKTWKDQVLGDAYDHKAKEGTILWAQDHYPKVNLVLPRCRTAHDGMADSLAIWHYAKDLV